MLTDTCSLSCLSRFPSLLVVATSLFIGDCWEPSCYLTNAYYDCLYYAWTICSILASLAICSSFLFLSISFYSA